jgi:hypothetical protein
MGFAVINQVTNGIYQVTKWDLPSSAILRELFLLLLMGHDPDSDILISCTRLLDLQCNNPFPVRITHLLLFLISKKYFKNILVIRTS